ncbi:MAG TPA: DUF202 domain-containing protein [Dongiaceae bacterium]
MISGYTDHAANERTFLAWIRTGVAVIAFGFVIEKFNLFLLTLAAAGLEHEVHRSQLAQMHSASSVRVELMVSAALVLVVTSYSLYLALS